MARAWSDQECKHLQKRLLDEAQALFERLGLQKTTVDDIVRAVGISKGAFYRFYGSKEELFFDVLERVETQVRTDLSSFAWDRGVPSVANLRRFFTQVADLTARVPFFKALNGVERLHLETRLPPETVVRHQADDEQVVIRLFQSWAEAGKIRTVDWSALTLVIQEFVLVLTRRPMRGRTPEVDLWIEMLSRLLAPAGEG